MKEAFIIGDIAGEMSALMRLVKRAPKGCPIIAVGDLVDRGPASNAVIEWFMKTPYADTVMGNHEHMMVDYLRKTGIYGQGVWLMNGGTRTLMSYDNYPNGVPDTHIDWLAGRRHHFMIGEEKKCLITHAPLHHSLTLNEALFEVDTCSDVNDPNFEMSLLWNRRPPKKREFYQVFGHNSHWGLRPFAEEGAEGSFALCIDQSRRQVLTGFHWPTGEIFEECYDPARSPDLSP